MKNLLASLLTCLLLAPVLAALPTQDPARQVVPIAKAPEDLSPLQLLEAQYGQFAGLLGLHEAPGDVAVIDWEGKPLAGIKVALFAPRVGLEPVQLLEVRETGRDGLADMRELEFAETLFVWSADQPSLFLDSNLLEERRQVAGGGALLLQLREPITLRGQVHIDGKVPAEGFQLSIRWTTAYKGMSIPREAYLDALQGHELPDSNQRAQTDENGEFAFTGFAWPERRSSNGEITKGEVRLYWLEELVFSRQSFSARSENSIYGHKRMEILHESRDKPLVVDLQHGGEISGRVVTKLGAPLGHEMRMQFGLPGHKMRYEKTPVGLDGRFRMVVPLPFGAFEAALVPPELTAYPESHPSFERKDVYWQGFSFEAPENVTADRWDLGDLVLDFQHTRALIITDAMGVPIEGATAVSIRPEHVKPGILLGRSPAQHSAKLKSDANGRILINLPTDGAGVQIDHGDYETAFLFQLGTGDRALGVTLEQSAGITIDASLPIDMPSTTLLVQIEGGVPLLNLYSRDRTTRIQAQLHYSGSPIAARIIDSNSAQAWSFTRTFGLTNNATSPNPRQFQIQGIKPGVPFRLRVLSATGHVFQEFEVAPLRPTEQRRFAVAVPTPLAPLLGQVVDELGAPKPGVEVFFGEAGVAFYGKTDDQGRFQIAALHSRTGKLMLDSPARWTMSGGPPGANSSGRIPQPVFFDPAFTFQAGVESTIVVRQAVPLTLTVIGEYSPPVDSVVGAFLVGDLGSIFTPWEFTLLDESAGLVFWSNSDGPFKEKFVTTTFTRPPGVATLLVATDGERRVEVLVGPEDTEVTIELPGE